MSKQTITHDLCDIADRLKEIDPSYYLVYNTVKNRYEIHSTKNIHDTLCLVSPYDELDARLLNLARKTRRERAKQIIEEMEAHNARLEKQAQTAALERAKSIIVK